MGWAWEGKGDSSRCRLRQGKSVVRRKRNKCTHNTKVTPDIQYDTQNLMISTAERMALYSLMLNLKIN